MEFLTLCYHRRSPSHSSSNIARFIKQNSSDQCGITGRRDNTDKFHEWSDPIKLQVHKSDTGEVEVFFFIFDA